jgi:hypothetical protein
MDSKYCLPIVCKMNGITRSAKAAYIMKYLTKAIPNSFPNAYMIPTTANCGKNVIHAVKLKHLCGYDAICTALFSSHTWH